MSASRAKLFAWGWMFCGRGDYCVTCGTALLVVNFLAYEPCRAAVNIFSLGFPFTMLFGFADCLYQPVRILPQYQTIAEEGMVMMRQLIGCRENVFSIYIVRGSSRWQKSRIPSQGTLRRNNSRNVVLTRAKKKVTSPALKGSTPPAILIGGAVNMILFGGVIVARLKRE